MALALPSGADLLQRERQVRHQGTGLTACDLVGIWQLQQIWSKGRSEVAAISSAGLRALQARLILAPGIFPDGAEEAPAAAGPASMEITNQVQLGALQLHFRGVAWLQGRRPLLWFRFDQLALRLGERQLWQRPLPPPPPGRMPFFALIAVGAGAAGKAAAEPWLAARGRGGGLALWSRLGRVV